MMHVRMTLVVAVAVLTSMSLLGLAKGETLLRAPEDAPQYRLGRIRLEDDNFGRTVLSIDYTRTREGKGVVRLAGRSPDGPLQITFLPPVNDAAGELRLSKSLHGRGGSYDYEFYLVTPAVWADKHYGDCLVSNKVRIGNPGSSPAARSWNDREQAAYEKHQLKEVPPTSLPDGHEAVRIDTPVAAGMRVKAGYYGDWIDSELLSFSETGEATVRFLESDKIVAVKADGWLAATPDMLRRAGDAPDSFSPSLRVLPGGTTPLARDAGPIPDRVTLPNGTPVLKPKGYNDEWETVYVVEDLGGTIKVTDALTRDVHGRRNGKLIFAPASKRYEFAISDRTLDDLKDPDKVKGWAINLIPRKERDGFGGDDDGFDAGPASGLADGFADKQDALGDAHVIERSYPVKSDLPKRCQKLPRDIEIPPGTSVAYNWARDWEACRLLADEGDTVIVQKVDSITNFAYRLPRYQVIIQNKTLRKIQNTQANKSAELKKTLRTWTDSTGQHKVEARFVDVQEGKVRLKTDAGREIKLPLDRLCDEDRELVESLGPSSNNPFE